MAKKKYTPETVEKIIKAIEINGAIWTNGRHSWGSGLISEYEKINLIQLLGYQVFFVIRKK
jgi:hypothetical protein